MSYVAALASPPSTPREESRSVSAEATGVDRKYNDAFQTLLLPLDKQYAFGKTLSIFRHLLAEHSTAGWDGDEAEPTSFEAVRRACDFVLHLPPKLFDPDISVNRYGDVELEWYARPDKLFTLAISGDGQYHFASLNQMERNSGAGRLGGTPPKLLLAIRDALEG